MKKELLLGTAVLTFGTALAFAPISFAQAPQKNEMPAAAAPERPAATAPAQEMNRGEPRGEAKGMDKGVDQRSQAPAPKNAPKAAPTQAQRGNEMKQENAQRPSGATAGQSKSDNAKSDNAKDSAGPTARESDSKSGSMSNQARDSKSGDTKSGDTAQRPATGSSPTTAGAPQDASKSGSTGTSTTANTTAGGSATLTAEQQTRVQRDVLASRNAPRVDSVNFNINVGVAVPPRIRVAVLPPVLVEIYPQYRGYDYFVVREEIIILDRRRRIVARVPAGGPRSAEVRGRGSDVVVIEDYTPAQVRALQVVLIERGFYRGRADGVWGPSSRTALIAFQRRQGFEPTGQITTQVVSGLGLSAQFNISSSPTTQGGAAGAAATGTSSTSGATGAGSVTPSGSTASGSVGATGSGSAATSTSTPNAAGSATGSASGSAATNSGGASGSAAGTVGASGQGINQGTNAPAKADTPAPASKQPGSTPSATPGGSSN